MKKLNAEENNNSLVEKLMFRVLSWDAGILPICCSFDVTLDRKFTLCNCLPVARTSAGWITSIVSEQNFSKSGARLGSRNLLIWISETCKRQEWNTAPSRGLWLSRLFCKAKYTEECKVRAATVIPISVRDTGRKRSGWLGENKSRTSKWYCNSKP